MTSSSTDRRLGLTGGTAIKAPVACATTSNITLSGEQSIDGVLTNASRVLVCNQTVQSQNGIYVSDTGTWTMDLDSANIENWAQGTLVFVIGGSANINALFQQTSAAPLTPGTSNMTFSKIATLTNSAVTQAAVQNGQYITVGTIAGTNTITGATVGTAPSALGSGQVVYFIPANTNTGAATFNRDSLGALNIFFNGAALIGGEMIASIPVLLWNDGTEYQLMTTAVGALNFQTRGTVASASTLVLDTANPYSQVTGNTGVNAITLGNGRIRILEFSSTVLFTAGASLILNNGGSNITTAAGDLAFCFGEASGVVRVYFVRASGNLTGDLSVTGNLAVSGNTAVTGNETVAGNLTVTGKITGITGNFTASLTGCNTSVTGTAYYSITNNAVGLDLPALTGISNTTAATITGLPVAIQPVSTKTWPSFTENNGTLAVSIMQLAGGGGTITLAQGAAGSGVFTSSGTKGLVNGASVSYTLN